MNWGTYLYVNKKKSVIMMQTLRVTAQNFVVPRTSRPGPVQFCAKPSIYKVTPYLE